MARFYSDDTPAWVTGLASASATGRGIEEIRQRRGIERRENRRLDLAERRSAQEADAFELDRQREVQRLADEDEARKLRKARAQAELDWDRFRFDTMTGRRRAPPINGPMSLGVGMAAQFGEQEHVRNALRNLPPERREEAMRFLGEQQERRQVERETRQLVGEIQAAMEPPPGVEPWLSPEQGQQMIDDLQDENRPDIGVEQIRQVLERQRTFVRNLRVARQTFSANYTTAKTLAASPEPPPDLAISRAEWMARRRDANMVLESWATNWGAFDPDEKYAEVIGILRSKPKVDEVEVRQNVLRELRDDPAYFALETPEERQAYRDNAVNWVLGRTPSAPREPGTPMRTGFDDEQPFEGYSTQYEERLDEVMGELERVASQAKTQEAGDAAVVKILEREGIEPESVPPEVGERLAQLVGTGSVAGHEPRTQRQERDVMEGVTSRRATRGPTSEEMRGRRPPGVPEEGFGPSSRTERARTVAHGNAQAALPAAAIGRGVGGGALAAVGAAAGAATKRGMEASEMPRTWAQLSPEDKRTATNLIRRDPKRARELLRRMQIDPASVPSKLLKKSATAKR